MNVLNLGAGGFIGAHLSRRLIDEGYHVTGIDVHSDKIQDCLAHPNFDYVDLDIRQHPHRVSSLIEDTDLVVDLIAHANPGIYVKNPLDVFHLNFEENLRIARSCIQHDKRLIQFSSCEVYGKTIASVAPYVLADPEDPELATFSEDVTSFIVGPVGKHRWIYSCAKQLLERVVHAHGLLGELNYTIIRPFNFIGPKIDYLPTDTGGVPRVFSYFMEALLTSRPMRLVEGGHQRRCYTHIDDAVECILRIVRNEDGVCDRQIFNIGSPLNEVSIRQLAELMCEIYVTELGQPESELPDVVEVSAEDFYGVGYEDCDRRIPDITKARKLLGWEPRFGLRETLIHSMEFYLAQRGSRTELPMA